MIDLMIDLAFDRPYPNTSIPRSTKVTQRNAPINAPTSAIAITGFFNIATRGFAKLKKTPKITLIRNFGYFETVSQRFCMVKSSRVLIFPYMISEC
jgi:hypothetical protein